jgi:Zn-dependent protease with chaperone function
LATAATVRLWQSAARSEILGTSVKVSDKQFPELYRLVQDCAARLQIPTPTVYIAPQIGALDAHTFGTDDDSFIVISGALVDHLTAEELRFVIGHECGHVQNNHAVYVTALYYLTVSAGFFVRWIVKPAVLALQSWARRAELTCDRAGLLCGGDLGTAQRALIKLALGSRKLGERVDIEAYLEQLAESQKSPGRVLELLHSHPYLPKRAEALKLFAQTHYFLRATGDETARTEGKSLEWCDAEVSRIVSVFGRRGASAAKE